jgi:hypothetical protein
MHPARVGVIYPYLQRAASRDAGDAEITACRDVPCGVDDTGDAGKEVARLDRASRTASKMSGTGRLLTNSRNACGSVGGWSPSMPVADSMHTSVPTWPKKAPLGIAQISGRDARGAEFGREVGEEFLENQKPACLQAVAAPLGAV